MDVQIVIFPEIKVAAIEHHGSPLLEHDTVRKLIAWKLESRPLDPLKFRNYGVHYTDPRTTPPHEHYVDFCLSIEEDVGPNPYGIELLSHPDYDPAQAKNQVRHSGNA